MAVRINTYRAFNLVKKIQNEENRPVSIEEVSSILGLSPRQVSGAITSWTRHNEGEGENKHNVPLAMRKTLEKEMRNEDGTIWHKPIPSVELTEFGLQYEMELAEEDKLKAFEL